MSAIGGLLGLGGQTNGTGITATAGANINPGTNSGQLQTAYGGAQNSLASQQALLTALQGQNGIGNQSQVYNQLQGVANGTGPNPAKAQLAQATQQNVANQAALMAGQRGASSNVGLMARQAAMQGANTQQQSIGQAATLQANQSLNALSAAGSLANTQAANQIGATTANTQAQQSEQNILQNANTAANNANVSSQSSINAGNTTLANTQMSGQQNMIGGIMNGAGALLGGAEGGQVPKMAEGGPTLGVDTNIYGPGQSASKNTFSDFLSTWPGATSTPIQQQLQQVQQTQSGGAALNKGMSTLVKGIGKQAGMAAMAGANGGNVGSALKSGGHVPGKPKVPGNSYQNDTVKALLSPGEVVIPNSVMQSKNPAQNAAKFVQAVLAKKQRGGK